MGNRPVRNKVIAAAWRLNVRIYLNCLGYHTVVAPASISGGERHSGAIAGYYQRLAYRIVLDEAAAFSVENEYLIQKAFERKLMHGRQLSSVAPPLPIRNADTSSSWRKVTWSKKGKHDSWWPQTDICKMWNHYTKRLTENQRKGGACAEQITKALFFVGPR